MKKNLFIFILLLSAATRILAQAPGGMNYQAIARDAAGTIMANQNICVQIEVTDGNGGPVLFTDNSNLSTNQFGLFTRNIGADDPAGFKAINWNGTTPWLHVKIDVGCTSSYTDMGTSQLLSVPYALNSADNHWDAVNGNDIENTNSGNVLIGTTTSQAKLTVSEGGLNSAVWVEKTNSASNSTGVFVTHAGGGNCFGGFQSGTGRVAHFYVYNTTNAADAMYVENHGIGRAANLELNNASNTADVLYAITNGTGKAGSFVLTNASNSSPAMYVSTLGSGSAIQASASGAAPSISSLNNGNGMALSAVIYHNAIHASQFEIINSGSPFDAVHGVTDGFGSGLGGMNTGGGSAVSGISTGTGNAGYFNINNLASVNDALYVTTSGNDGAGVHSYISGNAYGGKFEINNPGNTNTSLLATTTGLGRAGYFLINNTLNGDAAVYASTNGSGSSVWGINSGTGIPGNFWVSNAASNADAVYGYNTGAGVAVHGMAAGTGNAGLFEIYTAGNNSPSLFATTNGTGSAAHFWTSNASSSGSTVYITNSGSGNFIYASNGAYLSNGGVWTNASDVNLKENITAVDGASLLAKINTLPISQWNYKREGTGVKHIGPMAQDFYNLFSLGNNDKSISTIDPAGIALAAIKEQQKQIEDLKQQNADLKKRLETLENK
jgi:hypothetical protein